jgi:hypothetical protein
MYVYIYTIFSPTVTFFLLEGSGPKWGTGKKRTEKVPPKFADHF